MTFGRGLAWVRLWFAKPVKTGSIPATASTMAHQRDQSLGGVLEMIFDGVGGSDAARAEMKAAAYNRSYNPPVARIWLARQLVTHLRKDRDVWKSKAIEASRELSSLKRGNK